MLAMAESAQYYVRLSSIVQHQFQANCILMLAMAESALHQAETEQTGNLVQMFVGTTRKPPSADFNDSSLEMMCLACLYDAVTSTGAVLPVLSLLHHPIQVVAYCFMRQSNRKC
jgi:hypothetical protein